MIRQWVLDVGDIDIRDIRGVKVPQVYRVEAISGTTTFLSQVK